MSHSLCACGASYNDGGCHLTWISSCGGHGHWIELILELPACSRSLAVDRTLTPSPACAVLRSLPRQTPKAASLRPHSGESKTRGEYCAAHGEKKEEGQGKRRGGRHEGLSNNNANTGWVDPSYHIICTGPAYSNPAPGIRTSLPHARMHTDTVAS